MFLNGRLRHNEGQHKPGCQTGQRLETPLESLHYLRAHLINPLPAIGGRSMTYLIRRYLATLLVAVLSLALAGCVAPSGAPAPGGSALPQRTPARVILFSFSGKDAKGGKLISEVTLTVTGIAADGTLVHEENGAWVP